MNTTAIANPIAATDEARVELGRKLLDAISPGWDRTIKARSLDIADPYRCILCQVYGSFQEGLDQLEQHHQTLTTLGVPPMDRQSSRLLGLGFAVESIAQNVTLTAAWTRLIRARRDARVARAAWLRNA